MRSFHLHLRKRVDLRFSVVAALLIAILGAHAIVAAAVAWWFLDEIPLDSPELLEVLNWRARTPQALVALNFLAGGVLLLIEGLCAFLVWRAARAVTGGSAAFGGFVLCWWRGCLVAAALTPFILFVFSR